MIKDYHPSQQQVGQIIRNIISDFHGNVSYSYSSNKELGIINVVFDRSWIGEETGGAGTKEEIKIIIKAFGNAAVRAKKSGFDGVQIHAAYGYLLSQFLNPYHNQRKDEYGGDLAGRAKLIFEINEEIRQHVVPCPTTGYSK